MAQRIEKWLDARTPVREDEVAFSPQVRERVYSKRQDKVAVPADTLTPVDEPGYATVETDAYYYLGKSPFAPTDVGTQHITREDQLLESLEVVDKRLLGPEGSRFDAVFDLARTPEATKRHERITKKARRYRFGLLCVAAVFGGSAWSAAELPVPVVQILPIDSCKFTSAVSSDQYIQRILPHTKIPSNVVYCKFAGQNYAISNIPQSEK